MGPCRLALFAMLAGATGVFAADEFVLRVSRDGRFVEDVQSGLVWSRCAEGTAWDGTTCAGLPDVVTHAEAMAFATARSKVDGVRWRVPTAAELKQLSRRIAANRLGRKPFPAAPEGYFWSATTRVETATVNQYDYRNIQRGLNDQNVNRVAYLHAWAVDVDSGEGRGDMPRRSKLPVRLVRQADSDEKGRH